MPRAPRPTPLTQPIIKMLNQCQYQQDHWQTFQGFLTQIEMEIGLNTHGNTPNARTSSITANAANQYMQQVNDSEPWTDILGEIYMQFGTSNHHFGQFFTPTHVAKLMAALTTPEKPQINVNGDHKLFSTIDPTCGAGVMLMATIAHSEHQFGEASLLKNMYIGIDLDLTCCRMTAIQIAANIFIHNKQIGELIVINANTLVETITPKIIIHGTAPNIKPTPDSIIATMVPRKTHPQNLPLAVGFC